MEQHCGWAALAVTMAALVLQVMAVSLPFWKWTDVHNNMNTTRGSHSYVQGIWTICDLDNGYSSCWNPSEITAWMYAVRALETTSTILLFLVTISLMVYLSCFSRNLAFHVILIALLCICPLLILSGVIVFGVSADDGSPHFALAFAVLAAVLALIAAILLLVMIVCEKRSSNKESTKEDRPKQTVDDDKAQSTMVEEQKHASRASTGTPTWFIHVSKCNECGRPQSNGPFVDRSTSMLSFHSGKVHPSAVSRPDNVTRSTCMTPLLGTTTQYRHRTSPLYCGQDTAECRFGTDPALHGPCPNSLSCCKCQHAFPKKQSAEVCDCITREGSICDKCKNKQIKPENGTNEQHENSVEAQPVFYGNETTTESKNVQTSQVPRNSESVKESYSTVPPAYNDASPKNTNQPLAYNMDTNVQTNRTDQSKGSEQSIQKYITAEEQKKPVTRDIDRQKHTPLHDDKHSLNQKNFIDDTTPKGVGRNDTTNTIASNKKPAEQSWKENRNSTKARKPIHSRYAFDKNSGTLPNYQASDKNADGSYGKDEPTNRPRSEVSSSGSPVLKKTKKNNPSKKWHPPKWI